MQQLSLVSILIFGVLFPLKAQIINVQPYLQNASPNSINILWETTDGDESIVEWGLTETLGNTTSGTAETSNGTARIHDVKLEGLDRFTQYFYRVKTGAAISPIYHFKTPPFASDETSFRMIAMSDMQRDANNPNKFEEIINDGIIQYLEDENGEDLIDNLAFVMIPGDLVVNGNTYSQWEDHFFTPAQNLFSYVPVYPVLGNHENNSVYYFQYFHLPENGNPGFEEHWWHKDYGNTRIIGLNSNSPFNSQEQLDWLDLALENACSADSIDFVFAQLHHPHKSELWLPGESGYTGQVIERLENFSTNCGKPSVHFFGHTHGYSRGQSRDHKHLWINVASAGGAIDNWGEFPQFDYDEFSVSQDEWGFVSVEVSAGDDPQLTVKRISRGNDDFFKANELTDSLVLKKNGLSITTPLPIFPVEEEVRPECVILKADEFAAEITSATHGQSHWQVSTDCIDFSAPIAESWKNYQNFYFNEDTQAGDDLTDEKITGLQENTNYCWRVRYRDRELNWSDWSEPASFSTGSSLLSPNLLVNPGAESDLFEWVILEGTAEALTDGECNGISPHSGDKYFAVGGVCEDGPFGKCVQNVNVVAYADSIDTGNYQANFGGYLSNYSGSDLPAMRLLYLNDSGEILDSSALLSTLNSNWTNFSSWADIPSQTRVIQFELTGTRNAGQDNDSYFDDLFLRLGTESSACDEYIVGTNNLVSKTYDLDVYPNPFDADLKVTITLDNPKNLVIKLSNINGQKIYENSFDLDQGASSFELENLNKLGSGIYFLNVYSEKGDFLVSKKVVKF